MFQERERSSRLRSGSRRVEPLQGLVEHRNMIIFAQHGPFRLADTVRKCIRIEGWH